MPSMQGVFGLQPLSFELSGVGSLAPKSAVREVAGMAKDQMENKIAALIFLVLDDQPV